MSTTVNITLLAPIPSASVSRIAIVRAGRFAKERNENFRSWIMASPRRKGRLDEPGASILSRKALAKRSANARHQTRIELARPRRRASRSRSRSSSTISSPNSRRNAEGKRRRRKT